MRLVLDIIIRGTLAGMAVQGFFFSRKNLETDSSQVTERA
jgi:hypothetical protein